VFWMIVIVTHLACSEPDQIVPPGRYESLQACESARAWRMPQLQMLLREGSIVECRSIP